MTTLITNATVITVDIDRQIFTPGAVVVRDDRIVAVGPAQQIVADYPQVERRIDAQGKVVMPGFVRVRLK